MERDNLRMIVKCISEFDVSTPAHNWMQCVVAQNYTEEGTEGGTRLLAILSI